MQSASNAYKEHMKGSFRLQGYIRVSIGLINQEAQASAYVPDHDKYTYYSSFKMPLDNYKVEELYATCDQNYSVVDGSMYFLPRTRADVVLNQGLVSEPLLGPIEIRLPEAHDIKGVTIDFGKAYPVDFTIESDNHTVTVTGNTTAAFTTDELFIGATFLRFTPIKMVNGQSRFRLQQITLGIGIYFGNREILSATKKEHISPIMEELPTLDMDLTINNKNRVWDIENSESAVNYLEIGQEITVLYGQTLDDGSVEWMPGATAYLREWSADDEEMSFTASDRFEDLTGTYYGGILHSGGISLYDLAVDVLEDAGVDRRDYWLDTYLKDILVENPMPAVSHREALQLIANAGRCLLYQDRTGKIFMGSSFNPDAMAKSDNETYYSNAAGVLQRGSRRAYASPARDYTDVKSTRYFLPRQASEEISTGYISEQVAAEDGSFTENPSLEIDMEAGYKCFGITLEFGQNPPKKMIMHTYLAGVQQESYTIAKLDETITVNHEFPEFDQMIMEFTEGTPYNRVILDNVIFGDSTDYEFQYGEELAKTPKGTQLAKVRELQVVRTIYGPSSEAAKELTRETIAVSALDNRYTFYFSNASYDLACAITDAQEGQTAKIVESGCYFATVELSGVAGACEVVISGKEYMISQAKVSRQLGTTGTVEIWENPLVSDIVHAADLADWIGDYMKADREYDLSYRGDPRLDANDLAYLENKYVSGLLLRIYEHTLNFNGAFSGSVKARREMGYVADS